MIDLSVITPAHNPRPNYLERVLAALRDQTLHCAHWEYILVDNLSDPPLADRFDLSWHPQARQIREQTLGLTAARLRGIRESHGDLLIFADDDNVLGPTFLETALAIARDKPMIGAWSGQCHPEFEETPPAWTHEYWSGLVIREFAEDSWSNLPQISQTMPAGAGLCIRRAAAEHYVRLHDEGKRPYLMDRLGPSLRSGGDNDLAACACDLGLGVGLFASLELTHLIPPERLEEDYLLRLAENVAYSGVIVTAFRSPTPPAARALRRRVADWIRWALASRRQRRFFAANRRGYDRGLKVALQMRSAAAGAAPPDATSS